MRRPLIAQAVFGGFVGTIALASILYFTPLINWPKVDYAALIASLFNGTWDLAFLSELTLGTVVFPLVLIFFLWRRLPGPPLVKGVLWGLLLWLGAQVLLMPVTHHGLFSRYLEQPVLAVVAAFFAHLIYGICLGVACSEEFLAAIPGAADEEVPARRSRTPASGRPKAPTSGLRKAS